MCMDTIPLHSIRRFRFIVGRKPGGPLDHFADRSAVSVLHGRIDAVEYKRQDIYAPRFEKKNTRTVFKNVI